MNIKELNFKVNYEQIIQAKENFKNTIRTTEYVGQSIKELSENKLNELIELLIDSDNLNITNQIDKINNNYPFSFRFKKDYKDNERCYACSYLLTSPNGKQYIGQCYDKRKKELYGTDSPLITRWRNGNGYIDNEYLYSDIEKYGFKNFSKEILITGINWDSSLIIEAFMIKELGTYINGANHGYNKNEGSVGVAKGYSQPWEARVKRSLSSVGKKKTRSKYQAEKDGVIIYFDTQDEGELLTGVKQSNLNKALKTQKRLKGYLFSRVNKEGN